MDAYFNQGSEACLWNFRFIELLSNEKSMVLSGGGGT